MIKIIAHETYVQITVEDDGVGIDDHVLKQILERKQVHTSGVALLNIHLRLERLFGKGLHIKSEKGIGTTVSFIVPYP